MQTEITGFCIHCYQPLVSMKVWISMASWASISNTMKLQ